MVYRANPFLERMSERTTSDQEFVRLFSPKILEKLDADVFSGAIHMFRSPPGGGKTTLLRAFTPTALRAFWSAQAGQDESYRKLISFRVLDENSGPQLLGVFLSCAAGYADLPPGAQMGQGLFRALLDCRIVLKSLRSLASLLGLASTDQLDEVTLEYSEVGSDLKSIPLTGSASDLVRWAEDRERSVYEQLDSSSIDSDTYPGHVRFEGVLWLQSVRFFRNGRQVAPMRLLMIDDVQKLKKKQRSMLVEELVELRPSIPIWLAERSIALGEELISQGAREGRDVRQYSLDDIWSSSNSKQQFFIFAQNILDRRLAVQHVVPGGSFSQYLRENFIEEEIKVGVNSAAEIFSERMQKHKENIRYRDWISKAREGIDRQNYESMCDLYSTRILIARDESKRQLALELTPLPAEVLDERDSSSVGAAAEIFIHDELGFPYYFGMDRLCMLATTNVEELLSLAAALYDGMQAKQVVKRRSSDPQLSPSEQERRIKDAVKKKRDFIPKNHTEGARAQRLLDSLGVFCREKTFQINAPYAPGVTGIRLSHGELNRLAVVGRGRYELVSILRKVLAECIAENLILDRSSAASTSREGGTVFYLNRSLCAHYGLPLNYGGWQDVSIEALLDWMELGLQPSRRRGLEEG